MPKISYIIALVIVSCCPPGTISWPHPTAHFYTKKKQGRATCHESVLIPAVPAPRPPPPSTPSVIPKSLILDRIRYEGLILSTLPSSHSSYVEGTVRFEMLITAIRCFWLDADKSLAAAVLFSPFPLAVRFLLTSLSAVCFLYMFYLLISSGLPGVKAKDPVPPPIHPHPHRCRDRPRTFPVFSAARSPRRARGGLPRRRDETGRQNAARPRP